MRNIFHSNSAGNGVPMHYEPSTLKPRSPPPGSKAARRRSSGLFGLVSTRSSPSPSYDASTGSEYAPPPSHQYTAGPDAAHGDTYSGDINAGALAAHHRSYSNISASGFYRPGSFDGLGGHRRSVSNISAGSMEPVIGWASVEGDTGVYPPAPLLIPPTLYPPMGAASSAVTVAVSPTSFEQHFIIENSLILGSSGAVNHPSLYGGPSLVPPIEEEPLTPSLQPSGASEGPPSSSYPSLSRDHSSSFKLSSTVWSAHCTAEGYKYFHNNVTGLTMWESEMSDEDLQEAGVACSNSASINSDSEPAVSAAPPAPSKGRPQWHTAIKKLLWGVKDRSSSNGGGSSESESEYETDTDDEDSSYASSPIHAAPPVSNSPQYEGDTALHAAVSYGYTDDETLEEILVHGGLDVNGSNAEGETPLHRAALYAYFVGIELLSTHGANVKARDKSGQTAFHYAAVCGQYSLDCLQYLELFCPDGIYVKDYSGNSVLHTAAAMGVSGDCIQYLVSRLDINDVNLDGDTPLHLAFASQAKNSQDLIKAGADIDILNGWGQTPFAAGSLRADGSTKSHGPASVAVAATMTSTSGEVSPTTGHHRASSLEEERKDFASTTSTSRATAAPKSLYPVITAPPGRNKGKGGEGVDVAKERMKSPTGRTMRGLIRKITGMDRIKRKNHF